MTLDTAAMFPHETAKKVDLYDRVKDRAVASPLSKNASIDLDAGSAVVLTIRLSEDSPSKME